MNTFVKFELAKLLKEKGFVCIKSDKFWRDGFSLDKKDYNPIAYQDKDNIATIGEVVMWLYEKYEKWLIVRPYLGKWVFEVQKKPSPLISCTPIHNYKLHNSPTEAYEAAIEYCLTKLL